MFHPGSFRFYRISGRWVIKDAPFQMLHPQTIFLLSLYGVVVQHHLSHHHRQFYAAVHRSRSRIIILQQEYYRIHQVDQRSDDKNRDIVI